MARQATEQAGGRHGDKNRMAARASAFARRAAHRANHGTGGPGSAAPDRSRRPPRNRAPGEAAHRAGIPLCNRGAALVRPLCWMQCGNKKRPPLKRPFALVLRASLLLPLRPAPHGVPYLSAAALGDRCALCALCPQPVGEECAAHLGRAAIESADSTWCRSLFKIRPVAGTKNHTLAPRRTM